MEQPKEEQENNKHQNKSILSKHSEMGDRMKGYEKATRSYINNEQPIVARLDGHTFSKFTKGFKKPFDTWLHDLMVETTGHLMKEYTADMGYTQSDEITLIFLPKIKKLYQEEEEKGKQQQQFNEFIFGNQIQKFVSLSAANATNYFSRGVQRMIQNGTIDLKDYSENTQEKLKNPPCYFDCRVFNVPNIQEVKNNIMWRGIDCVKNSVSIASHSYFGDKANHGLSCEQKKAKLIDEKGIDWNKDYSAHLKYGTYIKKQLYEAPIPQEYLKIQSESQGGKKKKKKIAMQKEDQEEEEEQQQQTTCLRNKMIAFSVKIEIKNENLQEFLLKKQVSENDFYCLNKEDNEKQIKNEDLVKILEKYDVQNI